MFGWLREGQVEGRRLGCGDEPSQNGGNREGELEAVWFGGLVTPCWQNAGVGGFADILDNLFNAVSRQLSRGKIMRPKPEHRLMAAQLLLFHSPPSSRCHLRDVGSAMASTPNNHLCQSLTASTASLLPLSSFGLSYETHQVAQFPSFQLLSL